LGQELEQFDLMALFLARFDSARCLGRALLVHCVRVVVHLLNKVFDVVQGLELAAGLGLQVCFRARDALTLFLSAF